MRSPEPPVLVIFRASVIGLSTAIETLNAWHRGDDITIVAMNNRQRWSRSDLETVFVQNTPVELSDGWAQKTFDRCTNLGPLPQLSTFVL